MKYLSALAVFIGIGIMGGAAAIPIPVLAAEEVADSPSQSNVIDLGQVSVEGELRRPSVSLIDSRKPLHEMLPDYLKKEFDAFEARLLVPASLKDLEEKKDVKIKN